jgi:hypothetical protein
MAELAPPPWAAGRDAADSSDFHAACIDRCLYSLPYRHFILLDIDAVPLSRQFFDFMLSNTEWLVGATQAANHVDDHHRFVPYVSPSAMSISRELFLDLRTSFSPYGPGNDRVDCGAWVSVAAQGKGVPTVLLYPTDCLCPRWQVAWHQYGFVSAYGKLLCHLWASRAIGTLLFEFFRDYVLLCEANEQGDSGVNGGRAGELHGRHPSPPMAADAVMLAAGQPS